MKKVILFALFISSVLLLQNCKKSSTDDTTTTTTAVLQASINGTVWTPDTLSANITYTALTKTKVFNMVGQKNGKQVTISLTIPNSVNTNDFPIASYYIDSSGNLVMGYNVQQKNSSGVYVFVPQGTITTGGGSVIMSSIDATNKTITGYFNLTSRKTNYDSSGNITTTDVVNVTAGEFYAMPYKFISQ